jgi:hypothetical protein
MRTRARPSSALVADNIIIFPKLLQLCVKFYYRFTGRSYTSRYLLGISTCAHNKVRMGRPMLRAVRLCAPQVPADAQPQPQLVVGSANKFNFNLQPATADHIALWPHWRLPRAEGLLSLWPTPAAPRSSASGLPSSHLECSQVIRRTSARSRPVSAIMATNFPLLTNSTKPLENASGGARRSAQLKMATGDTVRV